jgi:hypothetical protein
LGTYLYFDDSFLRENYYHRLPFVGLPTGILWYTHRTPSTIYAMAKAIIQLCPHSPTASLPDFQSLSPKQKEGIYHHIDDEPVLCSYSVHSDSSKCISRKDRICSRIHSDKPTESMGFPYAGTRMKTLKSFALILY